MNKFIFFYRYLNIEDGEGFSYHVSEEDALQRMNTFKKDSFEHGSKVECGVAKIWETALINWEY